MAVYEIAKSHAPHCFANAEMWAGHPGAQKLDRLGSNKQVEVWTKPLGNGRTAALFVNTAEKDFTQRPDPSETGATSQRFDMIGTTNGRLRGGGALSMTKCDSAKTSQIWATVLLRPLRSYHTSLTSFPRPR